jgi:DNA polymerase elongation subunit (family B)
MSKEVFLDVECYPNYFLICFKSNTKNRFYEITDTSVLNYAEISTIMNNYLTIGFNSKNYDLPMITYALTGVNRKQLKEFSDQIITSKKPSWEICNNYNIQIPYKWNHIDIIEPTPGVRTSLKMYGARMHTNVLQDLPLEPDSIIENKDHDIIREYCFNDITITMELYNEIQDRIELREKIGKIYNLELRSKSDAQVAETIIKKLLSIKSYNNVIDLEKTYRYKAPEFIKFNYLELIELLHSLQKTDFKCNEKGMLIKNEALKKQIKINNTTFTLGIGGLHSNEKHQATLINEDEFLIDIDVVSYYPSIILNNNYYPEKLGGNFINLYKLFYNERIKAKENNDKIKSDTYKIILNGSFGKFGSQFSSLYSPNLLLHTTLTGQLSLLMLIENLSAFEIISTNTDSITIKGKKALMDVLDKILKRWEKTTNFKLEKTYYKAVYHESVNSYIGILEDNSIKCKGLYAFEGLDKNPVSTICIEAVIEYLQHKVEIEDTIFNNQDNIKKFLLIRKVEGGAIYKDQYLGRIVRWYYSTEGDKITYKTSGNKVADSDGAKPLMKLKGEKILDIDFKKYIDKSYKMLKNLGIKCITN